MNVVLVLLSVARLALADCSPYQLDACGICDGTNDCIDCNGVASGTSRRDACGVCDGEGRSCATCRYDERDACGVCFGDSSSCSDCQGTPNGVFTYDACGVCGGPLAICVDCSGNVDGALVYDLCDVCGGDSTSCLDCAGVLNGSKQYDRCDVCGGSNACLDCTGTVNGLAAYDACDICDGSNTECRDCTGVLNGNKVIDECGNCVPASSLVDERGHKIQCALDILRRDIDNALGLYLTFTIVWLGAVFVAILICLRRTRSFWYRLFWRFASLFSVREPGDLKRLNREVTARRTGGGGGAMPKTVVFSVAIVSLLMVSGVEASNSQDFYNYMCQYTNINSALANPTCGTVGQNACSAWTNYGIIDCYPNGEIRRVKFDLITKFGGRIYSQMFAPLADAISISFRGRTDGASLPLTTNPDLRQLSFEQFNGFDFTGFEKLTLLRIATSRFDSSGLPGSIGGLTTLETLSITDSDLSGTIIPDVCTLTKLKVLELINVNLFGPAMCNPSALVKLERLDLQRNNLVQPIPDFSSLTELYYIKYDNNRLGGKLDVALMPQSLFNVFFNYNLFTSISADWKTACPEIFEFHISHNAIDGPLPLVSESYIYFYDVSYNKFSSWGSFGYPLPPPWALYDVSHNSLTGPTPSFSGSFPTNVCHFEGNLFCSPSDIHQSIIAQGCTYSLAPTVCSCNPNCVDCLGVPSGTAQYDDCDICNGDGSLCRDCNGVQHGTSVRDGCGVCNGDGDSCRDCAGIPNGSSALDICGVCNGDSSTCGDCAGAPLGPYRYDACGLCTLPATANLTCIDCRGVPHGKARFDELGVCQGDGDFGKSRLSKSVKHGVKSFWKTVGLAAFLVASVSLLSLSIVVVSIAARRR